MTSLIDYYANDLLRYAQEQNQLEEFYTHSLVLTQKTDLTDLSSVPDKLKSFIKLVPPSDIKAILSKFIDISASHLGSLDAIVTSAIPLTEKQKFDIEQKLIIIFDRQINMITKIDPTLLGGLRIIVGHTVIDNTIKKKLSDLKQNINKRVYFK